MAEIRCGCGAVIVAETKEQCDAALLEHNYSVHDLQRPVEVIKKESANVEPEQIVTHTEQPAVEVKTEPVKAAIAPPPLPMVEALIMQLDAAMSMIKVPDYVESAAKAFTDALRKWAEGK